MRNFRHIVASVILTLLISCQPQCEIGRDPLLLDIHKKQGRSYIEAVDLTHEIEAMSCHPPDFVIVGLSQRGISILNQAREELSTEFVRLSLGNMSVRLGRRLPYTGYSADIALFPEGFVNPYPQDGEIQ